MKFAVFVEALGNTDVTLVPGRGIEGFRNSVTAPFKRVRGHLFDNERKKFLEAIASGVGCKWTADRFNDDNNLNNGQVANKLEKLLKQARSDRTYVDAMDAAGNIIHHLNSFGAGAHEKQRVLTSAYDKVYDEEHDEEGYDEVVACEEEEEEEEEPASLLGRVGAMVARATSW